MTVSRTEVVKQQVAAQWERRAPRFDEDCGQSIRTPAGRAAWDRILGLVLAGRGILHALDAGCDVLPGPIDFLHAAIPVTPCDAVLLDGDAAARVERARRKPSGVSMATVFSGRGGGVDRFLAHLESARGSAAGRIPTDSAQSQHKER